MAVAGSVRNTTNPAPKDGEARPRRYYNDAVIALDHLYEAAVGGSAAAQEMLRCLADRLLDAAGKIKNTAAQSRPKQLQKGMGK